MIASFRCWTINKPAYSIYGKLPHTGMHTFTNSNSELNENSNLDYWSWPTLGWTAWESRVVMLLTLLRPGREQTTPVNLRPLSGIANRHYRWDNGLALPTHPTTSIYTPPSPCVNPWAPPPFPTPLPCVSPWAPPPFFPPMCEPLGPTSVLPPPPSFVWAPGTHLRSTIADPG